jgi:hypothetical protein
MFQVIALIVTIVLIARELRLPPRRLEWIVPAIVGSVMTTHNWIEGQVGGVLLLLGAMTWLALRRNGENLSAMGIAALINLKPQFALLLLAVRARIRFRAIAIGSVFLIGGVVALGWSAWLSWIAIAKSDGLQLAPWNVSLLAMLARGGAGPIALYAFVPAAMIVFSIAWVSAARDPDLDRVWLTWGIVMLLLSPVGWVYYAATLLGPLIAWGERFDWPITARIGIACWLIPLHTISAAASMPVSWERAIVASPYLWGTLLVWWSVIRTRCREPQSNEVLSRQVMAHAS